ncbi:hypothetical protein BC628DRAFT_138609 [Trametes gibbosa]|nr:hypothetical protein BC628DRAFT_138609 [Trametes gibbosa]
MHSPGQMWRRAAGDGFGSGFPACADQCRISGAANTQCNSGDAACLCVDGGFITNLLKCVEQACPPSDTVSTANSVNLQCDGLFVFAHAADQLVCREESTSDRYRQFDDYINGQCIVHNNPNIVIDQIYSVQQSSSDVDLCIIHL